MKIKRIYALVAIALLVVGAIGAISMNVFAKGTTSPAAQVTVQPGSDSDTTELQDGDQNAPEDQDAVNDVDSDTTELQEGDQNTPGTAESQEVDEAGSADGQDETPIGTPAITVDQAQAAALAVHPGTVIKTELDDENGQLIYSVEFDGGVDVKVDAMTGAVLGTDTGQD
jgi:uncharacterized membrane protein YkoI